MGDQECVSWVCLPACSLGRSSNQCLFRLFSHSSARTRSRRCSARRKRTRRSAPRLKARCRTTKPLVHRRQRERPQGVWRGVGGGGREGGRRPRAGGG